MWKIYKTPEGIVWLVLMAITSASWGLGANHQLFSDDVNVGSTLLVSLAFLKIRLIMFYFMEVREGPYTLRLSCDAWLVFSCLGVLGYTLGLL